MVVGLLWSLFNFSFVGLHCFGAFGRWNKWWWCLWEFPVFAVDMVSWWLWSHMWVGLGWLGYADPPPKSLHIFESNYFIKGQRNRKKDSSYYRIFLFVWNSYHGRYSSCHLRGYYNDMKRVCVNGANCIPMDVCEMLSWSGIHVWVPK